MNDLIPLQLSCAIILLSTYIPLFAEAAVLLGGTP